MALSGPKKTVLQTVSVVLLMGGLAWASVPFYDWFCRVTGFGGVTNTAETGSDVILDKTIKIRFDASRDREMAWEFRALQPEMTIRIGETGLAFYEAYNPTDRPIAGQASYNVAPFDAGGFFTKIECFCFTEQVLMPGERVEMPVTFFVDPAIVEDRDAKYTKHITLSYTFYEIDMPETAELSVAPATTQTN
ncbi:cytochrome c oxidase assembly protein [Marinovum sp. 2_MG-2023]|uniref:cytochrome c oxidase assembly protein n=1 Tax=Roseobacteraceae TaxID=2854170 RepID=UPI001FD2A8C1|nr:MULTISPECIES: cytochrome c oxidase assembly protein [Roseobacteraceae]MCJ7873039.1 cytochrome c oxidase assembly protein [Phaeobacter sp. J2-8]MDO6730855.1 cytochrome c oxidase assembly protein [Marinovum sp. 2_MG-2023]MDO6779940.1 cytochrome c oxidase assembly protein [Marinovum sp. 1_MG-2023]